MLIDIDVRADNGAYFTLCMDTVSFRYINPKHRFTGPELKELATCFRYLANKWDIPEETIDLSNLAELCRKQKLPYNCIKSYMYRQVKKGIDKLTAFKQARELYDKR